MKWEAKFDVDGVMDKINSGIEEGLKECAQDLSEKSQKLCPKDRGYNGGLVSTHYEKVDAEMGTMTVGYKAPHAWLQHEARRYKHKHGEQAQFVRQPLEENGPRYLQMIAARIRAALKT